MDWKNTSPEPPWVALSQLLSQTKSYRVAMEIKLGIPCTNKCEVPEENRGYKCN